MDQPDIFLSYNREDSAKAKLFAEALAAEGFSVWWDATLKSGENYDEVTEQALLDSKAVVVLWSEKSAVSRWVRAEATEAERAGKLVPAMIEPCKRPIMFELKQTAELSHWKGNRKDPAWLAFVADLRGHVGRPEAASDAPAPVAAPITDRHQWLRRWPWAALLAVILVGAAFAWMHVGDGKASQSGSHVPVLVRAFVASGTGDSTEAAMASGITDELIVRLRRIPEFQVATALPDGTAPSDAFDKAYVVDGNIRSSGEQLKVTVRLSDDDGQVLWSETFDRRLVDLFDVQQEIAAAIANTLSVSFDVGAKSTQFGGTDNPEAYAAYMQYVAHQLDLDQSVPLGYLEQAVALDPDFVMALSGLAYTYSNLAALSPPEEAERWLTMMDEVSARALAANPNIWAGHTARHGYEWVHRNFKASYRHREKAEQLSKGRDPQFINQMALNDTSLGRVRKAVITRRANELIDPIYIDDPWKVYDLMLASRFQDSINLYARLERQGRAGLQGFAYHAFWAHLLGGSEAGAADFARERNLPFGDLLQAFKANTALLTMSDEELKRSQDGENIFEIGRNAHFAAYTGHPELAARIMRVAMERPGGTGILFMLWFPVMAEARKTDEFERLVTDIGLVEFWRESGDWGDYCRPLSDTEIACK